MTASYAVVWREGVQATARGRLELGAESLRLEGIADAVRTTRELPYDGLAGVHIGRHGVDRLGGRPSVVLELHEGEPLLIASVAQAGAVAEIAARLVELTGNR